MMSDYLTSVQWTPSATDIIIVHNDNVFESTLETY